MNTSDAGSQTQAFRVPSEKFGLWLGLFAGAVLFIVAFSGHEGRARAIGVSIAVLTLIFWSALPFRRRKAFWLVCLALTLIHLVLIIAIPWSDAHIPSMAIAPFALADFAVSFSIAYAVLVGWTRKRPAENSLLAFEDTSDAKHD